MIRRSFTIAAALSSLLWVATVVAWARSYGGTDYLRRCKPGRGDGSGWPSHSWVVQVTRGDVRVGIEDQTVFLSVPGQSISDDRDLSATWGIGRLGRGHLGDDLAEQHASFLARLGFYRYDWGLMTSFSQSRMSGVSLPAWLLVLLFAVMPERWTAAVLRDRRRRSAGRCARCGYDLRATPDQCPECGTIAAVNIASLALPDSAAQKLSNRKPVVSP